LLLDNPTISFLRFNLVEAWGLDRDLANDLITVFELIVRCHQYPDTLGYEDDFAKIVRLWRPAE